MVSDQQGVSVILCCYNSRSRIRQTLEALAIQEFSTPIAWEVLMIDNASTDNTSEIAAAIWAGLKSPVKLRIIPEPQAGLGYARKKGIEHANFDTIVFCDDDNWLSRDYVHCAFIRLSSDHSLAACGGKGIPVFEVTPPVWFDDYAEAFAVGPQNMNSKDGMLLNLYGAGIVFRKEPLKHLYRTGFTSQLKGRTRENLGSADDFELTYACVLLGYTLKYDENLSFRHYITRDRLSYAYLKKLFHAFGTDGPIRNLYYSNLCAKPLHRWIKEWTFHLALGFARLIKYSIVPPKKNGRKIFLIWSIAYINQLFIIRKDYKRILSRIETIKKTRHVIRKAIEEGKDVLSNAHAYHD